MTPDVEARIRDIAEQRKGLLRSLVERPSGLTWCAAHSDLADEVVRLLHQDLQTSSAGLPPLAILAVGGYGRRELAPSSDIDLTVLPSDEASPQLDQAIRRLFQDLHWAFCTILRLDVGYAYRLVSDVPGLDPKSLTGLLDLRHVAGPYELTRTLEEALRESLSVGEFLYEKISERRAMFEKYHDSPYVSEPQLKEGAGGLRCLHCSNWIRKAIDDQPARPSAAFDTIVRFRNLLHFRAGKHQDLLSRQRQAEIADLLGAEVGPMMREVVESGELLHSHYRRATEKLREGRFALAKGVLSVQGEARLVGKTNAGEAAVGVAFATRLGLAVSDLPVEPSDGVSGAAAAFALATGEPTLRNLNRCGLLERLLPRLTDCRYLVPEDPIHTYTVFEHTLRVVRYLDSVPEDSYLADIKGAVTDLEPLYLAALLHDVGKINPAVPHSELGARWAAELCHTWRLGVDFSETVEWLVREHLTMNRFVRVRDLDNPATIAEFAQIVGDIPRLNMLALLTWADVNAVGPSAWTPSQDIFLRDLHARTQAHLQAESNRTPDATVYRQRLLRTFRNAEVDAADLQAFVESLPASYLTTTPAEVVRLHLGFARRAEKGEPTVELFHRHDLSATEITVCTRDASRLLNRLLGVIYAYDLSVAGIRAATTTTSPHVALDVFAVSFGGRPIPAATAKQVSAALLDVLEGRRDAEELLRAKGKDPARAQEIFDPTFVEGNPGILEIRAPRGRGMPYRFSRLIADLGWNVVSARVGQWAGSAAASFYIEGPGSRALTEDEVIGGLSRIGTAG